MRPVRLLAISVFLFHAVMTLLFVVLPPMLVDRYVGFEDHWKIYVPTMIVSVFVIFPVLRRTGTSLSNTEFP